MEREKRLYNCTKSMVFVQRQSFLVYKTQAYQRRIGSDLMQRILGAYQNVRQIVLLTNDRKETKRFYNKNGVKEVSEYHSIAFMK